MQAIDEDFLLELKVLGIAHLNVTPLQMLTHLRMQYGSMDYVDITALMAECDAPWDPTEVPTKHFNRVEKARRQLACANIQIKRGRKGRCTLAPEDLFKVNEECKKLNQNMATAFHNIIAKVLYLVKRARLDASVAIAVLTTRVREPDKDDWRKLEHLVKYFKSTTEMPLILGGGSSGILNWYVDTLFAVHSTCKDTQVADSQWGEGSQL